MGCDFEIILVCDNQQEADSYIEMAISEVSRIESMISSWNKASQTAEINAKAGKSPVVVDAELFNLIQRSVRVSDLTSGAFDITYAAIGDLWKFNGEEAEIPDEKSIKGVLDKVGYQKIQLNSENKTVFLPEKGMKIAFGAIGKGYAADRAKTLLQLKGVKNGIINASGDLNAWGTRANGENWVIGITNPTKPDEAFSYLPIVDQAVVTSGDYLKYTMISGERYAHIINPKTAFPCKGIFSVTILTKSAELADALATAVFVMGTEVGLDLINQLKAVECIIVDDQNIVHTSSNISLNQLKP